MQSHASFVLISFSRWGFSGAASRPARVAHLFPLQLPASSTTAEDYSRSAGWCEVVGYLVHVGDVGSLKGLAVGVALGWAVAPGNGSTGAQDHEGPHA
jgi:hypothetical protein